MPNNEPAATIERLGLTVSSVFIPFSQSRSKDNKDHLGNPQYSLNWHVTVSANGRPVIMTDYSAGMAHAPSYNKPVSTNWNRPPRMWRDAIAAWECEHGRPAMFTTYSGFQHRTGSVPIAPKAADVLYSLTTDSDVLNYSGFEDWAANFGYDADSRSAETIYRACLEIALQFRAGIGDAGMSALQTAFQDY